jgi:hypothetical protein
VFIFFVAYCLKSERSGQNEDSTIPKFLFNIQDKIINLTEKRQLICFILMNPSFILLVFFLSLSLFESIRIYVVCKVFKASKTEVKEKKRKEMPDMKLCDFVFF